MTSKGLRSHQGHQIHKGINQTLEGVTTLKGAQKNQQQQADNIFSTI